MCEPKRITITPERAEDLLRSVEASTLSKDDAALIRQIVETYRYVCELLDDKNTSLRRLRQQLFGDTSEKTEKVLERLAKAVADGRVPDGAAAADAGQGAAAAPSKPPPRKRKGHGRNGAAAYTGAKRIKVTHATLKHGDRCPVCGKGNVYLQKKPGVIVRFMARAPIDGCVWELEKLRCGTCQEIFTAEPPPEVGPEEYDASCTAMVGCLKYGIGTPFNRIEGLQANMGIPLPAGTQWELVAAAADPLYPPYETLLGLGAQSKIIYTDDTPMKILAARKKDADRQELDADRDRRERKGIFTTGIVCEAEGHKIALFFTGPKHAGENLAGLLARRAAALPPPIHMSDALSRNEPKGFDVVIAKCQSHARRNFLDVSESFPEECRFVIETMREVFHNDAVARERALTPEERLAHHQAHSGPVMEKLRAWMQAQFDEKRTEPNSGLGRAIKYMFNHWEGLTLFLRKAGAPLQNNLCERVLKMAIRHRTNSLFYKTENGARVGDIFMTLIHTCTLNGINAFDYLTQLLKHTPEVARDPKGWLPWTYKATLAPLDSG